MSGTFFLYSTAPKNVLIFSAWLLAGWPPKHKNNNLSSGGFSEFFNRRLYLSVMAPHHVLERTRFPVNNYAAKPQLKRHIEELFRNVKNMSQMELLLNLLRYFSTG
ncbi:hypothetical protein FKM82_024316 [Ascaphus truei]